MDALDFVYELENLHEAKKTALDIMPKRVQKFSYGHIALNVFPSIYPEGFESEADGANKFEQLRIRLRMRVKQYVDISKRINVKKFKPGLYEKIETESKLTGSSLDFGKTLFKDSEVEELLKDGYKEILDNNVKDKQVQVMMLDSENKIGQMLLNKVDSRIKLVGKDGLERTGWEKDLYNKEKEEQEEKEQEEKEKFNLKYHSEEKEKEKPEDKEKAEEPKIMDVWKGSSTIKDSNRKVVSSFLVSVLKRCKEAGLYKDYKHFSSSEGGSTSFGGQNYKFGRQSIGKESQTGVEFVYKELMSSILDGISFIFADISIRALLEYELKYASEESDDVVKKNLKSDLAEVFDKLNRQFILIGISMLASTSDKFKKSFLKFADQALDHMGFDNNIEYHLNYFEKSLRSGKVDYTPVVKKALENTKADIANLLSSDSEFVNLLSDIVVDKEAMRNVFSEVDPELASKIKGIRAHEKFEKIKKSQQEYREKVKQMIARQQKDNIGETFRNFFEKD